MRKLHIKYWACMILATSSLYPHSTYQQAAIQAAENLSKDTFYIVADKFDFLRAVSLDSPEDTFHVVDVGVLADRLALWQKWLPDVFPYYAVKTNPDRIITGVLAHLGTGFDCASEKEIEQMLSLGVPPSQIIFAHPRKPAASILYAKKNGIDLLTFDSLEELDKMARIHPDAKFLLRIKTDDSHSVIQLSNKFGATLEEAYEILDVGLRRGIPIVGIAFHVGSNCTHIDSYTKAILEAAELFRYCKKELGISLTMLDLGGGWPGTQDDTFIQIAAKIEELLHTHFSAETRFIAEPGRYFAAKTTTLAMKVIGKKPLKKENKIAYFLSNGIYGFFMSSLYYEHNLDKILTEGWLIKPLSPKKTASVPSLLWGPTCDSGDKIFDGILVQEVETGDFLTVENLGAYTKSLETFFNGIPPSKAYYICECTSPLEVSLTTHSK